MRKFKLVREYPNSPKIGTVAEKKDEHNCYHLSDIFHQPLNSVFIENYPEFWQEIKEYPKIISFRSKYRGDWGAILTYKDGRCIHRTDNICPTSTIDFETALKDPEVEIYQVQTSDTEVFTVGDEVEVKNYSEHILSFKIIESGKLYAYFKNGYFTNVLNLAKAPTPLFITKDHVEIYEGDEFYFVDSFWNIGKGKATSNYKKITLMKEFSTKEKAKTYIEQNKPRFSVKDVEDALDKSYTLETIHVGECSGVIRRFKETEFKQKLGI